MLYGRVLSVWEVKIKQKKRTRFSLFAERRPCTFHVINPASQQVPDMRDHIEFRTVQITYLLQHKRIVSVKNANTTKQFL